MDFLVLGDSHTDVFKYCNYINTLSKFDIVRMRGATAYGLKNPNSKTNAFNIYCHKLSETPKHKKIIIMLGEVDCGTLLWLRTKKYNISQEEQINISIDNLLNFIENKIVNQYEYEKKDIIVCGVTLPTVEKCNRKYYNINHLRRNIDISKEEHTKSVLIFNEKLKQKCKESNYNYIDITKHIIDKNGLIKKKYCTKKNLIII